MQKAEPNSIFVNGGDFYQGTAWYTLFKWTVVAPFANMLDPTAMVRDLQLLTRDLMIN